MSDDYLERYLEHDAVEKGWTDATRERGVIVLLTNKTTGTRFPMVWILTGPRKNTREYPSKGWSDPLLDWPGEGYLQCRCRECERLFRADTDQQFCRTCARTPQPTE
jgi:hypothetical protein